MMLMSNALVPYVLLLICMCSMEISSMAAVHHPVARKESSSGTIRCIEKERQALLQFKQGLVDEQGILTSWGSLHEKDDRGDCCQWRGVQCSKATGQVISLDLQPTQCDASGRCNRLQGTISSSLLMLEQLHYLDLSGNDFGDKQIPGFIGSLVKLAYLNLSNSAVSGEIPPQFKNLTNLESLDLSNNMNLLAENFAWASNLSLLKTLNLDNVELTKATDWFHIVNSLPSLTYLNLGHCFLPDPSPLSLVNSSKSLGYVYLGSNRLSAASMFPWLLNISDNLIEVDLSSNSIEGPIPKDFGNNMNSLSYLDLSSNGLKGFIPDTLGRMSSLLHLDLSENKLNGPILEAFGNLSSLSYLDLSDNSLQGPIPSALSNMSSLSYLDFCSNQLEGSIPESIGKMSSLSHLALCKNKLKGPIPEAFGSITSLSFIDLFGNQLQGHIPETLGNLKNLSHLRLSSNQLHGPIPEAFGNMTSLLHLDLSDCHLEGTIPAGIGSLRSLLYLYLSGNQLEGALPNSFRNLCSLQELYLYGNNLSGDLMPLSGCIKKSLVTLYLHNNSLSGPLPDFTTFLSLTDVRLSLNQLNGSFPLPASKYSPLESLDLQHNQITGSLPEGIGQLPNLWMLDVSSNLLDGIISEVHLSNLSSLEFLDLSFNKLAFNFSPNWTPPFQLADLTLDSCNLGPYYPNWLQTQNQLSTLSISNSGIADKLPRWFWGNLAESASVNLSHNGIHGVIPDSMFQHSLTAVDLSFNSLQGPIPSFLTQVTYLDLSNNELSGSTLSWCPAANAALQFLDLSNNLLSGKLPDCWVDMNQARVLNFGNNSFSGTIPSSFGNLNLLEVLSLASNKISGTVPPSMKNCTSLRILDLSENLLSGPVPTWIGNTLLALNVLILRHNRFFGSLPLEICHLPYVQILDLSMNMVSGTIPSCLNNITEFSNRENASTMTHALNTSQWTNVEVSYDLTDTAGLFEIKKVNIYAYLVWKGFLRKYTQNLALVRSVDLSSNKLTGEIPVEISELIRLQSLNLSRNDLNGSITPKLGQLKLLESLDLSRNHLSNEIPTSFSELNFLGILDLSYNNLSGRIPSSTQLQSFNESTYIGNPELCGSPLQHKCEGDETETNLHNGGDVDSQDKEEIFPGFYISIGLGFITGCWGAWGILLVKRSWRHAYFRFCSHLYDRIYVTVVLCIRRSRAHSQT